MMRLAPLLLLAFFLLPRALADPILFLAATPTESAALTAAAHDHTAYTLPPATLQKTITLERTLTTLHFTSELWTILQLLLLLTLGLAARLRFRFPRGPLFCLALLVIHTTLNLPLSLYAQSTLRRYGLSIESWPSWFLDYAKSLAIFYLLATLGSMLFLWLVRRSPRRWWLWFASAVAVAIVIGAFATPYLYDPLFNHFSPLQQNNPQLVADLERVVARTQATEQGIDIPPNRIFLMRASDKVTTVNAYVTGFGRSKRVGVWDTSLASGSHDDLLAIFSHEMGHYALNHVPIGIALTMASLFLEFWLGFHAAHWLLRRFGSRWRITSLHDWAALVLFLFLLAAFSFATEPVTNSVSRWFEHNADVYGQEALEGIVADPAAITVRSFQRLGEQSLDDPNPNPFVAFWTYTHPPTSERAAFARHYDPWLPNTAPKYFRK